MNPRILAQADLPADDVAVATALSAALATLLMRLRADYPCARAVHPVLYGLAAVLLLYYATIGS